MADNTLGTIMGLLTKGTTTTSGGTGGTAATSALQTLINSMTANSTVAGSDALIKEIYKTGFEKYMPTIYNTSNQTGLRPGSTTQQTLLVNDLASRLAGEASKTISTNQSNAANALTNLGNLTKSPTVQTTNTGLTSANVLPALAGIAATKIGNSLWDTITSNATSNAATPAVSKAADTAVNSATGYLTNGVEGAKNIGTTLTGDGSGVAAVGADSLSSATGNAAVDTITKILGGSSASDAVTSAAGNAAVSAIPGVGELVLPTLALGNLLGVNEAKDASTTISQAATGLPSAIGDMASTLGNSIKNAFNCFITTAVCELQGKPDNCRELTVLRDFRDSWLKKQSFGEELIAEYYDKAPKFLEKIADREDRAEILHNYFTAYIMPAVEAWENRDAQAALDSYLEMVNDAFTQY